MQVDRYIQPPESHKCPDCKHQLRYGIKDKKVVLWQCPECGYRYKPTIKVNTQSRPKGSKQ